MGKKIAIVVGLLLVISLVAYVGSGFFKRQVAVYTGHSTICIDGVKYLQFISGASVKYNKDGSVATCN